MPIEDRLAIDLGDAAGWVACFTPDGEFAIDGAGAWTESVHDIKVGASRGEAELLAFAQHVVSGPRVRHWSGNRVLTGGRDGDPQCESEIVPFGFGQGASSMISPMEVKVGASGSRGTRTARATKLMAWYQPQRRSRSSRLSSVNVVARSFQR